MSSRYICNGSLPGTGIGTYDESIGLLFGRLGEAAIKCINVIGFAHKITKRLPLGDCPPKYSPTDDGLVGRDVLRS